MNTGRTMLGAVVVVIVVVAVVVDDVVVVVCRFGKALTL